MGIVDISPEEVGSSGLVWLLLSYGFVLFQASNMISEGSDLLLLVPSLAGLVGGVVLPLLGAVPDGAIMLFSGLGNIETAQKTLSVGVGALAGSTIMLLTVPWGLSVFQGKVDIVDGKLTYNKNPKLKPGKSFLESLDTTGVTLLEEVQQGAKIMMLTTVPYFLIQIPAWFIKPGDNPGAFEKNWALLSFILCISGFIWYIKLQLDASNAGMDEQKRIEVMKDLIGEGKVSLSGALNDLIKTHRPDATVNVGEYQSIGDAGIQEPPPRVKAILCPLLFDQFRKYDKNNDQTLSKIEITFFLRELHEKITDEKIDFLFDHFDKDKTDSISFDEFVLICYSIIAAPEEASVDHDEEKILEEDEEEEDVPEDIASLPPDEQQAAIKKKAFTLLAIGTLLVVLFADPMVDVMHEVAVRTGIPAFYVSFVLAPLASNASEVIASLFYAAKKTRKSISVSLVALEGAASMNNTFCLSIFMGLIYFRGLSWQFSAETISILLVQYFVGYFALANQMTSKTGLILIIVFPISVAFIATLEAFGFD